MFVKMDSVIGIPQSTLDFVDNVLVLGKFDVFTMDELLKSQMDDQRFKMPWRTNDANLIIDNLILHNTQTQTQTMFIQQNRYRYHIRFTKHTSIQ